MQMTVTTTDYRRALKTILFWIVAVLLLALTAKAALGVTLDLPTQVHEGDLVIAAFSGEPEADLNLQRNGVTVATASPYQWQTTAADAGLYVFEARAMYPNGTNESMTATLEVIDLPLTITVVDPAKSEYAAATVPLAVRPSAPVDFCYFVLGAESNTLAQTGDEWTGGVTRPDGVYTVYLKCKQGTIVVEENRTFLIDTTAPEIVAMSPAAGATVTGDDATLQLTTDEVASCVLSHPAGETMTSADRLHHAMTLSPDQGVQSYTVRCSDVYANERTSQFTFTMNRRPHAAIEIDTTGVLRAGSYDLVLTTTEPLADAPTFTYSFHDGGSGTVALEKTESNDGTRWTGYLSVAQAAGEKIGSFNFRGFDKTGTEGTVIDEGKLFRVDTTPPGKVTGLTATPSSRAITLAWSDLDRDAATYKIFRTTEPSIPSLAPYATSDQPEYVDSAIGDAVTYYYAVSAVDEAKNEGPESDPVSASAAPLLVEKTDGVQTYRAEELAKLVETAILDVGATTKKLEGEPNEETRQVILALRLLDDLASDRALLEEQLSTLRDPAAGRLEPAVFSTRIADTERLLSRVRNGLPVRVLVEGVTTYDQSADDGVRTQLLPKALALFDVVPHGGTAAYAQSIDSLMAETTVTTKIMTASVTFADRSELGATIMKKSVTLPASEKPVLLLEFLPKDVAATVDGITFSPEPTIVERDPLLRYDLPAWQNTFEFSYILPHKRDLATARGVRSLLFPEPTPANQDADPVTNVITARAIAIPGLGQVREGVLFWIAGLLIAGLLLYYFFIDAPSPSGEHSTPNAPHVIMLNAPVHPPTRRKRPLPRRMPSPVRERTLDEPSLGALLGKAHAAINEKEYRAAIEQYRAAISRMTLSTGMTHRAAASLLYYKLLLYKTMLVAVRAAEDRDVKRLALSLDCLTSIARKLPETDTMLVNDAKRKYRELRVFERRLRQEDVL